MLKVCEHELKCCPYCGSERIKQEDKLRPKGYSVHAIICEECLGIFLVPCED
jgi:hypothetical protein